MSKYIIKNCPANLIEEDYCTLYLEVCNDCTDCVIKQAIEKCKDMASDRDFYAYDFANEILQLFDIEEVRE